MKSLPQSRIGQLLAMPADAPVRIYTLQAEAAWSRAQSRGFLSGDAERVEADYFGHAYGWMRARMAEQIPAHSGDYPIWAWLKRPSAKQPSPDRPRDARIRITAVVPRGRILLSDFDAWHSVLNEGYHCATEAEWEAHDARWPQRPYRGHPDFGPYLSEIEPSWRGIFDLSDHREAAVVHWLGSRQSIVIQACVDRIHLNEVTSVRFFAR